jgi:hypothetical protein
MLYKRAIVGVVMLVLLANACTRGTATPAATQVPSPTPSPTLTGDAVSATPTADDGVAISSGEGVEAEADRDSVFTIQAGTRSPLPAPQQRILIVGDGVDVDEAGRALIRFADLLTVEVLRDGELVLEELAADEQSAFVTVLQKGGTLINDFDPRQEIDRRFTVRTAFAVIEATGTRFLVVREANSPLEWVVGLDAAEGDLTVSAEGITKPVDNGVARWIAPIGEPSAGISADMDSVMDWLRGIQEGEARRELGEVVWSQADILADTFAVRELVEPGELFEIARREQGVILLRLDPSGRSYALQDCNADGISDIVLRYGKVWFDLRAVLARVRAIDVTVINLAGPGSGTLRGLGPDQLEMAQAPVQVKEGAGQILTLRADRPYHYAELEMEHGCLLGLSLTPPTALGEPGPPRPAVPNWQVALPLSNVRARPPENGRVQAVQIGESRFPIDIEIDGTVDDWQELAAQSGVGWTSFEAIVHDMGCERTSAQSETEIEDLSARVRFAYDDAYLYVAFSVQDDGYVGYSGNDGRYFLGDSPQILLDLDLDGDWDDSGLSEDDVQLDFYPGFEQPAVALWQLADLSVRGLSEASVAARSSGSGYDLEARIPWKSLGVRPAAGLTLGIAASVSDNDTVDTNAQECMISTAPERDWQRPSSWGTLILGAAASGYE